MSRRSPARSSVTPLRILVLFAIGAFVGVTLSVVTLTTDAIVPRAVASTTRGEPINCPDPSLYPAGCQTALGQFATCVPNPPPPCEAWSCPMQSEYCMLNPENARVAVGFATIAGICAVGVFLVWHAGLRPKTPRSSES